MTRKTHLKDAIDEADDATNQAATMIERALIEAATAWASAPPRARRDAARRLQRAVTLHNRACRLWEDVSALGKEAA